MRKGISAAQGPEVPGAYIGNILGMYYENHCNVYVGLKGMCIYMYVYIYPKNTESHGKVSGNTTTIKFLLRCKGICRIKGKILPQ